MLSSLKLADPWGGRQLANKTEGFLSTLRGLCVYGGAPVFLYTVFYWLSSTFVVLWDAQPLPPDASQHEKARGSLLRKTLNLHLSRSYPGGTSQLHTKNQELSTGSDPKTFYICCMQGILLASYIEMTIGRYKDSYEPTSKLECHTVFVSVVTCWSSTLRGDGSFGTLVFHSSLVTSVFT